MSSVKPLNIQPGLPLAEFIISQGKYFTCEKLFYVFNALCRFNKSQFIQVKKILYMCCLFSSEVQSLLAALAKILIAYFTYSSEWSINIMIFHFLLEVWIIFHSLSLSTESDDDPCVLCWTQGKHPYPSLLKMASVHDSAIKLLIVESWTFSQNDL